MRNRASAWWALGAVGVASLAGMAAQEQPVEEADAAAEVAKYADRAEGSDNQRDWYNYGTALLNAEEWPGARSELARAADASEGRVQRFSRYNLGVASAMEGRPDGEAPVQERRPRLLEARDAFREVLREDPEDPNARWNLEVVNRWLEEAQEAGGGGGGQDDQQQQGPQGAAGGQGPADPGGEAPTMSQEEAEQILEQAAGAEEDVRNKTLRRGRLRDPVVERNW